MKILKVTIKKERGPTQCHFEYPERWDAQKIHVLAYEDHPENLGKVEESCLCVADDDTANWLLEQPEVQEVGIDEANALGKQWRPSVTTVTDEDRVITTMRKILSKPGLVTALKNVLEQREIDSLDEKKAEPGIGKGKEFDISEFIQAN